MKIGWMVCMCEQLANVCVVYYVLSAQNNVKIK